LKSPQGPASTGRGSTIKAPDDRPTWSDKKMARIAGVNIPTNKRVVISLQYIHGIGPKFA